MTKKELEALCTNCGLCCIIPGTDKYCEHVKVMPDKTTRCKIYNHPNRIGMQICAAGSKELSGFICNEAMLVPVLWDDCPYNNMKIAQMIKNANKGIVQIIHENA